MDMTSSSLTVYAYLYSNTYKGIATKVHNLGCLSGGGGGRERKWRGSVRLYSSSRKRVHIVRVMGFRDLPDQAIFNF